MASPAQTDPPLPERVPIIHNLAMAGTILTPLVMLLPPRKMDLRFLVLAGTFSLSSNQLAYEYTGTSLYSRFGHRFSNLNTLPAEAEKTREILREHREREGGARDEAAKKGPVAQAVNSIWMGDEGKDWQKKRFEEHQKSLEEGKGLGGIIMDQIVDVWNGNWKSGSKPAEPGAGAGGNGTPEKK
jgi:hypothetical protein